MKTIGLIGGMSWESSVVYYDLVNKKVREMLGGQVTIYAADRYHQYSNLGLSLVGEVVAEKSGQDYATYVDAESKAEKTLMKYRDV